MDALSATQDWLGNPVEAERYSGLKAKHQKWPSATPSRLFGIQPHCWYTEETAILATFQEEFFRINPN
jgi:hypothetical protein